MNSLGVGEETGYLCAVLKSFFKNSTHLKKVKGRNLPSVVAFLVTSTVSFTVRLVLAINVISTYLCGLSFLCGPVDFAAGV
jgi:hypothetical protein